MFFFFSTCAAIIKYHSLVPSSSRFARQRNLINNRLKPFKLMSNFAFRLALRDPESGYDKGMR